MEREYLYFPMIRELRLGLGLTQVQLCDAIDWPRASYSRFENGDRPVPTEFVDTICRFYKLAPNDIFKGSVWVKGVTR